MGTFESKLDAVDQTNLCCIHNRKDSENRNKKVAGGSISRVKSARLPDSIIKVAAPISVLPHGWTVTQIQDLKVVVSSTASTQQRSCPGFFALQVNTMIRVHSQRPLLTFCAPCRHMMRRIFGAPEP